MPRKSVRKQIKQTKTRTVAPAKTSFNYKVFAKNLWKKPSTKYVLGGVALTALVPVIMRAFRSYPEIGEFVRDQVDAIEEKFETVGEKVSNKIADLRGTADDELTNSRH